MRNKINALNNARKGSLFELFYVKKLNQGAELVRHLGLGADVRISDGGGSQLVDLKIWRRQPRPKGKIQYYWNDYLTDESIQTGLFRIFSIDSNGVMTLVHGPYENSFFESFYTEWEKNRRAPKRETVASESGLKKAIARKFIDTQFPDGSTRLLFRKEREAYGGLTVAPQIISDDPETHEEDLAVYLRTVLCVYENGGRFFKEYWLIDHKKDIERIKKLLRDDGCNRNKKRIPGDEFPSELKFPMDVPILPHSH
jgi:hypothetical protein